MARLSAAFIGIFIMPYKEPLRAGLGLGFLGGPLIFDLSFDTAHSTQEDALRCTAAFSADRAAVPLVFPRSKLDFY